MTDYEHEMIKRELQKQFNKLCKFWILSILGLILGLGRKDL